MSQKAVDDRYSDALVHGLVKFVKDVVYDQVRSLANMEVALLVKNFRDWVLVLN